MSTNISSSSTGGTVQDDGTPRPRKHFLCSALWVAAIANALVPAVFFSDTHLFGPADPRYRIVVTLVILAEYGIAFVGLLVHADVGFASGYAVATAAIVTIGSVVLAFVNVFPLDWSWGPFYVEILVLAGLAFAVVSNVVFLIAGIRYARAIHPRLHLGGFFLGIAACLALVFLYGHIIR